MCRRGHAFGVWIGADAPLVRHQQHTWRLIQQTGELADEVAQIHQRVDHLLASGFDYFATESGTTEFTASDDQRMVAWMDALATHVDEAHGGRETYIKIHTSTGQTVENYKDPETQEPLNFNFLPHYADPRMGADEAILMAHVADRALAGISGDALAGVAGSPAASTARAGRGINTAVCGSPTASTESP